MMKTIVKPSQIILATLALSVLTITGCKKESELDTIKDAQMCLNKAAPGDAQACVSKLASNTSAQANQLKCSAYFIQEGLGSPTALIDALDASNSDSSCPTCSDSMAIISQLKFSSTGNALTDASNADAAFDVCSASGVGIYTQLASMVNIATTISSVALTEDAAGYSAALTAIPNSDLGSIALQTYTSSCSSNNTAENNDESQLQKYCGELAEVTNGLTEAQVGACLKQKLKGAPEAGCPLP